jgi:hypothetical protein
VPRSAIHIDRMEMEIPGVSSEEGQRLALLVAAGLAVAGAMPAAGDIPVLQIDLVVGNNFSESELAQRIIAATLNHLQRTP